MVHQILLKLEDVRTMVDYGAGKGRLGEKLTEMGLPRPVTLEQYDPGIPDIAEPPSPADMVVCIDVLEHIEPQYLQDVLKDLRRCALRYLLVTIHCGPAEKVLSDGRNAHLIQAPPSQWCSEFWLLGFQLMTYQESPGGFWALWRSPSMQS